MIEYFAQFIPEELKDMSGSVFYSGKNAFSGKKELYILGLNPGGSDIAQRDETISWHTDNLLNYENPDFSEYKDGIWRNGKPGRSGLQPKVLHLLKELKLDPYKVPASNVCFVRSPREVNILNKFEEYSNLCWGFHENVIKRLEIKMVLCFGKTAGRYVRSKMGADILIDKFVEKNGRRWKTLIYQNVKQQIVIEATHPSRADWTNKEADISDLVKKHLIKE